MTAADRSIEYEEGLRLVRRLATKGQLPRAVLWADRLCQHRPDDPRAYNQAGMVHRKAGQLPEAIARFRRALLLQPEAGEVWANLGTALRHVADFGTAFRCRQWAACARPDLPDVRLAFGFSLLVRGDLKRGFAEYEHRAERRRALARYTAAGMPQWDGGGGDDRHLVLVTEQGAGDTVQFLRFVAPLSEAGARVTVACPPQLERLVRSAPGVAGTMPLGHEVPLPDCDGVEALMSLPARLGIDLSTLPAPERYLAPPRPGHALPDTGGLRVGLCWSGNVRTPLNEQRRIPFGELDRLRNVAGATFYGLQIGDGPDEIGDATGLVDLAPHIDDFADTAAMIDQMDLMITVDTSVAHVAGALGKPVWTLLANVADWRWGLEGDATPWYPSMRLFRQTRSGDWRDVVDRVGAELRRVVAGRAPLDRRRPPFASANSNG